jgi:hypothetical protein
MVPSCEIARGEGQLLSYAGAKGHVHAERIRTAGKPLRNTRHYAVCPCKYPGIGREPHPREAAGASRTGCLAAPSALPRLNKPADPPRGRPWEAHPKVSDLPHHGGQGREGVASPISPLMGGRECYAARCLPSGQSSVRGIHWTNWRVGRLTREGMWKYLLRPVEAQQFTRDCGHGASNHLGTVA